MATLHCIVAIPTRELYSGEVYYASIPSVDGSYGVLPGHEMIVSTNKSGGILVLNLDEAGTQQKKFLLYEGASQVFNNIVTVLGRFGKNVEDIDPVDIRQRADKLRLRIEELEKKSSDQDEAELETSRTRLEWYQMQLDYVEGSTN